MRIEGEPGEKLNGFYNLFLGLVRHFLPTRCVGRASRRILLTGAVALCLGGKAYAENVTSADASLEKTVRNFIVERSAGGGEQCVKLGMSFAQPGIQEIAMNFVPGQWAIQVDTTRTELVERLDYLVQVGFLEKRNGMRTFGPIATGPVWEYRPTYIGWAYTQNQEQHRVGPCFYVGFESLLRITGSSESGKGADGYSQLAIHYVIGVSNLEEWARSPRAQSLFPGIQDLQRGRPVVMQLVRAPNGRIKTSKEAHFHLDDPEATRPSDARPSPPDFKIVQFALERAALGQPGRYRFPPLPLPCFPLMDSSMASLWKSQEHKASFKAVVRYDPATPSNRPSPAAPQPSLAANSPAVHANVGLPQLPAEISVRSGAPAQAGSGIGPINTFSHSRLVQLERAGLIVISNDARRRELTISPAKSISGTSARDGNCLDLGEVRVEAIPGPLIWQGGSFSFKARYVVVRPAAWIQAVKRGRLPGDLVAVLQHGQPFTASLSNPPGGWYAYLRTDDRPRPTSATLNGIGIASVWHVSTSRSIAQTSQEDFDAYVISLYGGIKPEVESVDAYGRAITKATKAPDTRGSTSVNVEVLQGGKPVVLVLSGYEPIEWRIKLHPSARVRAVLATGYHAQSVVGLPQDIPLVNAHEEDGLDAPGGSRTVGSRNVEALSVLLRNAGRLKAPQHRKDGTIVVGGTVSGGSDSTKK